MFWKAKDSPVRLPKLAVCYTDPAETRAITDALARDGLCEPLALLSDEAENVLWLCGREKPSALLLEAVPDAMERFDDPDRDISGRCELSARLAEALPECRVYLTCDAAFREMEPVLQKAVETGLICGYCIGSPTRQQIIHWLDGASGRRIQR